MICRRWGLNRGPFQAHHSIWKSSQALAGGVGRSTNFLALPTGERLRPPFFAVISPRAVEHHGGAALSPGELLGGGIADVAVLTISAALDRQRTCHGSWLAP
jgi:hypothetical protein